MSLFFAELSLTDGAVQLGEIPTVVVCFKTIFRYRDPRPWHGLSMVHVIFLECKFFWGGVWSALSDERKKKLGIS